jgi:anti-sigma B factor antagonist
MLECPSSNLETELSQVPVSVETVTDDRLNGKTVVRVIGELDFSTSHHLDAAIQKARNGASRVVIVDFTQCRYLDSSVLTILVRTQKLLHDSLRVVVPEDAQIRRIFTITNLDKLLQMHASVEDAER